MINFIQHLRVLSRKWRFYNWMKARIRAWKRRLTTKTRFCYGEKNPDKKFFVILSPHEKMGLYSTVFCILPIIEHALAKNYIPVIDFQNSFVPLIQDEKYRGKENAWEYFFEQPVAEYSLEEVYQSKHVTMMLEHTVRKDTPDWNNMFPTSEKEFIHWSSLISKYIRLNAALQKRVEEAYQKLFKPGARVLGVGIRAGYRAMAMAKNNLINGHPIVGSCEEYIEIIEKKMEEWNCEYLFIALDDREYFNQIIGHFGEKCIYFQRVLRHFFENGAPLIGKDSSEKSFQEFKNITYQEHNREYVIETHLLSRCTCLYSCIGSNGEFAYFLNGGKYEKCETYNIGMYQNI